MKFKTAFDEHFLQDLKYWSKQNPRKIRRIIELMESVERDPFSGIGSPEKLKGEQNRYSRRIDQKNRLVYLVKDDTIIFVQCRYHY